MVLGWYTRRSLFFCQPSHEATVSVAQTFEAMSDHSDALDDQRQQLCDERQKEGVLGKPRSEALALSAPHQHDGSIPGPYSASSHNPSQRYV